MMEICQGCGRKVDGEDMETLRGFRLCRTCAATSKATGNHGMTRADESQVTPWRPGEVFVLYTALAWVFGLIFLVLGLISLMKGSLGWGLLGCLSGALLIAAPISRLVSRRARE